ncbi:MAG TPA: hypothetical protein VEN31_00330 [Candidatus Bathyarchaeia archaeon]|nr:hypothetical protein [Candidatus Bathyarchaeia archaeon]
MKDEPSLGSLDERLERLDTPIRIWREARDRAFAAAFGPKEGKLSNLMGRLPQAAGAAAAVGLGPRDEVFAAFDEICDLYAHSDAARCSIIRGIVHNRESRALLGDYMGYASRILKQGGRPEWLERGIVAAAIDDQRVDYRDWLMAVGDLYLSARAAHLDPTPVLKRVAERSNPERHAASPTPTRDALSNFEDSAYFMTSILPQLR